MDSETAAQTPTSPQQPTAPQPQSGADMISLMAWIEVNKKRLMIGGAIALVLIAVASIVAQQQARKEITASEALSDIRVPYTPGAVADPETASTLLKMAQAHKGTRAAARALLISGSILFSERNYDEAQKRYNLLLQDYPGNPWAADATFGIAVSLEAQGKSVEALAKYEDVRKRFASSTVINDTKLAIARLYEASNKQEDAFKLYEEVATAGANTTLGTEAKFRQEELLRLRPELAKLNAPIAPPMPTIAPMTNRTIVMSNPVSRVTNTIRPTNTGSPSQPVQIKLSSPTPAPVSPEAVKPVPAPAK